MVILGITDSFTSGAAVVVDGRVVAAVNEERLDRNKMLMGFPRMSIAEVIRLAGIEPEDIDHVAMATVNLFWRENAEPYRDYYRESKNGFGNHFPAPYDFFSGLLPALPGEKFRLMSTPVIINQGQKQGPKELFSVCGIQFASARSLALHQPRFVSKAGYVKYRASSANTRIAPSHKPTGTQAQPMNQLRSGETGAERSLMQNPSCT